MRLTAICFFLFLCFHSFGQQYECVAFYNLENLFDTEDDTVINDAEYLPEAGWTEDLYQQKLRRMSSILGRIGSEYGMNGPAFIGVSEIENRRVLEDLLKDTALVDKGYQILHFDGPDWRGVDVAAFYKTGRFTPIKVSSIPVKIYDAEGKRKFTRDILYVKGLLGSEMVHITVNHWPSRFGGRKVSGPYRDSVASINRKLVDSVLVKDGIASFIIMGDLNDDPNNKSVTKVLKAKSKDRALSNDDLFNPYCKLFKKGIGSNAWRDAWHNFDQIIVSQNMTASGKSKWQFQKAKIFKRQFMLQKSGRYKGYPFRTKAAGEYVMGYSDHFPVISVFQ